MEEVGWGWAKWVGDDIKEHTCDGQQMMKEMNH